jgi:hypothetical protein
VAATALFRWLVPARAGQTQVAGSGR